MINISLNFESLMVCEEIGKKITTNCHFCQRNYNYKNLYKFKNLLKLKGFYKLRIEYSYHNIMQSLCRVIHLPKKRPNRPKIL